MMAQVTNSAQNNFFYSSFQPNRYHFVRSLTPTATTLAFQNPTSVSKSRESRPYFRKRHGGSETLMFDTWPTPQFQSGFEIHILKFLVALFN